MPEISARLKNLEITDDIFKGIRYFITGEVHEKVESLLKSGGAERQNYFSDYVTHLIVGKNHEENDIADANDVYEIPAVTPQWIFMCASLRKLLDCKPYLHSTNTKLFSYHIFCFSNIYEDRNNLWGLITYNGGQVHTKLTRMCNILVTGVTDSPKYLKAESLGPEKIRIVTPDWVAQAVRTKSLPDPALFHPKLINWPKPVKPAEPTTAITGFEPDTPEKDKVEEKAVVDSTQALLEKLKQRMPWNQPPATTSSPTSTSSDPVAPPNVVAPSFLSKIQNSQDTQVIKQPRPPPIPSSQPSMPSSQPSSVATSYASAGTQSPNPIPRSIVHHTPNSQQNQQPLQHSPLNISRLIGQPQTRPTSLQQLRGQLNTSQIHQQLLQQRIQQQNQQGIIQRSPSGQVNQQLLHQQLSQGQRQSLHSQLMNQQGLLNQQMTSQAQVLSSINQSSQSQNVMLGQQEQTNQQNQSQQSQLSNQLNNQQSQKLSNQQNRLGQSPSPNHLLRSPQQNQLLSPQHIQNQLMNHQQQQNQNQVNQLQQQSQMMHQQTSHFLNQQQTQSQLNQPQDRTNQLLNQQQERANQLLSQQQERANQLLNQQQERANQILNQQERANQLLNQQERASQLLSQQQNHSQLNQQQLNQQQNQMLRQQQSQKELEDELLSQLSPQTQMIGSQQNQQVIQQNQQMIQQQNQANQQSQQLVQQNQPSQQNRQLIHQNPQSQQQLLQQQNQAINQLVQSRMSQQSPILTQNQLMNQQNQQIINRANQHQQNSENLLSLSPSHHLGQLSPQQIQQLQQLKREQQQLLNQSQNQMGGLQQQNLGLNQQNISLGQQNLANQQLGNQNQQLIGQNQQMQINQQQLIQNRVIHNQNLNQQLNQGGQSFGQQGLSQHLLNQKQQLFNQQQINTSQHQQMIQNQQNLTSQQQFVNQNQFDAIQQQKLNQANGQGQLNQQPIGHMTVQQLNQQLNSQNLGQQLNQQLLQQNQQSGLNQGTMNQQQLNQGMGMEQALNQNIGLMNQQTVALNQQGSLNLQASNQQINQMNQGLNQQVIRAQFPQQVLVSQGQQGGPQRAQLNQQIWGQQQQGGTPIQGQQIIRHPVNVAVQQSPTSGGVGPRIQWPPGQQPGIPQRQYIQLDTQTHNQLQKMPPDQQALFVAKLQQKQRQLQLAKQVQQRGGGHILIRGNVPPGLTAQQQVQWLQQQAKQQGIILPPNIQQNLTPGTITPQQGPQTPAAPPPHAPGLSPINQSPGPAQQFVGDQPTAQQLQLRQYRLQQLQLQREQAQKNALVQQGALPPQAVVRPPLGQPPAADSTTNPQVQVNPKTKTALANMLSIKLQSGGTIGTPVRPEVMPEPSAAGTLRMMTAQHNAAINSKPQEIIALQQRRVISGPNGEIIKPPVVPALSLPPQSEPPKLQYSQKPPIPVQHRVGPFYGHNPNLKLPPDLFLLGCIFVVVEVEDYLEEKLPGWQQKIEKYGGEVEKQYCNKVTHVLCETQRHGVVMQALRDLKRCVTIRWLSDVIKRKQVLPPWTALHLPQIYLDITPASKHLISISGFESNTRQVVKQMIMYTGAKCTTYFSKHNTLLICAKAEGKKFSHAKKWGIPVVNVQWLTDIILGNFTAMNQMDNQIYQTYSNPPNLSFDPKLVPNMMHAWKAPINISQESYERVKRSASPVSLPKAKKMKTEHTDENENITDEVFNSQYKILFTQVPQDRLKVLEKMVRDLGGIVSKDHKDFTHLVIPRLSRTHKLLFAVTKSCHILPEKWLEESSTQNNFLPESGFSFPMEEFNRMYNVTFEKTLCSSNRDKLFEGKTFWVTPSVIPSKRIVCELIEHSGGKLERIRRSRAQIEATNSASPLSYFILTAEHDLHLVADLLKNKKEKQNVICNVELVLSAVLKQEFEVEPYLVTVT